jgi:hypothetical protein
MCPLHWFFRGSQFSTHTRHKLCLYFIFFELFHFMFPYFWSLLMSLSKGLTCFKGQLSTTSSRSHVCYAHFPYFPKKLCGFFHFHSQPIVSCFVVVWITCHVTFMHSHIHNWYEFPSLYCELLIVFNFTFLINQQCNVFLYKPNQNIDLLVHKMMSKMWLPSSFTSKSKLHF